MKLFIFNNKEQLIRVIEPLEAVSEEEINKIHKLEAILRYSDVFDSNNDISQRAAYIGHKDYDNEEIFHFYKIDHITKTSLTEVKLLAVNSFYDDMQSDGYIKDFRPTNKSVMSVLQTLLEGTMWQLGIVKSTELVTLNFYYLSRKEAISKLLEVANIEIRPRVELSKNTIIRRYLDVFTTLGANHGKVFVHGKDLLTVSEKASQGAIYTAAIGRGKGEEITDSNGQATGGYGRRITFKDIVWRRNLGNPVDKPKGQEFVEIPELTAKYGFANGTKPRLKIIEFQDEEDPEKLLRLTYAWLEKNSRVQVEYKATVNNVGNCNLGDTVGVYNPTIGIKYKTRVFSVKRNLIDNSLTEFGIGDKVTTSPFGRATEVAKNLKNLEDNTIYWLDQLRDKIKDNFLNEDGYNYDLGVNNKYHLPAGLYSFDKPIDQEPTKVVYVGAGKVAIANSKLPDGKWDWKTFLDGNGATLDLVNTGTLRAGIIQSSDGTSYWNLDTGEFKISQKAIEDVTTKVVEKKIEEKKPELKGKDGVSNYIHTKYSNNENGEPMTDDSNSKFIGIYTGESKDAPTNASDYSWTKIAGEDGKKGDDGEKAHTLTADLRLEGRYLNGVITGFKAFLTVLYDGSPLPTSDVVITHSYKGAGLTPVNFTKSEIIPAGLSWPIKNLKVDTDTADGTPLYVNVLVQHFKGLRAVASARLDNTVDVELINSTVKKFKTFESTLDKFESKISEVDSKRFKLAYTRENLCSETAAEKKGSDLYFNTKRPLEANKEYYILADADNVPEIQNTRIYGAKNNGDGKLLVGGLNIWKVSFEKAQTNVNIFPLGGETKVKNVQIYEVPEMEEPKEDIILPWQNSGGYLDLKFKRKLKSGEVLTLTFDVEGTPTKRYGYYYGINGKYTSKPILSGKNSWTFRLHEDKESVQFTTRDSGVEGKLSNVKCVLESFDLGYKTEYNISEMETTVRQTKSEIDLSVKKNEVINSINLSGEGVKINADKVDISGTLSAYTGKIGTFSIGLNDHANYGKWITGVSQYQIGISDGTNGREGAAIWVNWGNSWNQIGDDTWYVQNDGQMFCKNLSYFGKKITAPGGIDVYKSNVYGLASSGHTTPIWWSEFEQLKSQISDKRLKENIQPTKVNALDTLNQIEMVEFNWKKDGKFEKLGAIAQQVENIDNSLVVQHFEDKDTPTDYLRINYFDTIPYLIKAVQELTDICVGLQEEVKQLKERSSKDGI